MYCSIHVSFRLGSRSLRDPRFNRVYVTTDSLVFYCFGPTDRKTKWGHSVCGNMYLAIMVKDRELASSE